MPLLPPEAELGRLRRECRRAELAAAWWGLAATLLFGALVASFVPSFVAHTL